MSDLKINRSGEKCPLDLVPLKALMGPARVFQHGAFKYAPGNWHEADDDQIDRRYMGAMLRHASDAQNPNGTYDPKSLAARDVESGLPEIDHMICGLLIERALLIKRGILPADPGLSVLLRRVEQGVRAPSIEPEPFVFAVCVEKIADLHPGCRAAISGCCDERAEHGACEHTTRAAEMIRRMGTQVVSEALRSPNPAAFFWERELRAFRTDPAPRPTGPGDTGRCVEELPHAPEPAPLKGPRFVAMNAADVPAGAVAEGFPSWQDDDRGARVKQREGDLSMFEADFWTHPTRSRFTWAIVDTRPKEGGY